MLQVLSSIFQLVPEPLQSAKLVLILETEASLPPEQGLRTPSVEAADDFSGYRRISSMASSSRCQEQLQRVEKIRGCFLQDASVIEALIWLVQEIYSSSACPSPFEDSRFPYPFQLFSHPPAIPGYMDNSYPDMLTGLLRISAL